VTPWEVKETHLVLDLLFDVLALLGAQEVLCVIDEL